MPCPDATRTSVDLPIRRLFPPARRGSLGIPWRGRESMRHVVWSWVLVVFAVVLGLMGTAVVSGAVAGPAPVSVASDPTAEEQEALRQVAGAIWTPELAAGWNMNSDVADVLSTATGEVLRCSE